MNLKSIILLIVLSLQYILCVAQAPSKNEIYDSILKSIVKFEVAEWAKYKVYYRGDSCFVFACHDFFRDSYYAKAQFQFTVDSNKIKIVHLDTALFDLIPSYLETDTFIRIGDTIVVDIIKVFRGTQQYEDRYTFVLKDKTDWQLTDKTALW